MQNGLGRIGVKTDAGFTHGNIPQCRYYKGIGIGNITAIFLIYNAYPETAGDKGGIYIGAGSCNDGIIVQPLVLRITCGGTELRAIPVDRWLGRKIGYRYKKRSRKSATIRIGNPYRIASVSNYRLNGISCVGTRDTVSLPLDDAMFTGRQMNVSAHTESYWPICSNYWRECGYGFNKTGQKNL